MGERLADAVLRLCRALGVRPTRIALVAAHGQTIHHAPRAGATLQTGEPAAIAVRSGITTVGNFRAADVATGGEGAPLAPFAHRLLFAHPRRAHAVQNSPPHSLGHPRDTGRRIEAYAFALLGWAAATGRTAAFPKTTGAARPVILGHIAPGRSYRGLRLTPD